LVHNYGGIVIWAHPFRFSSKRPSWLKHTQPDGMEVASSNMHREAEAMAKKNAAQRGILTFRNSDAHDAFIVGRYGNELDIHLTCVEDFITYVRKRRPETESKQILPVGTAF